MNMELAKVKKAVEPEVSVNDISRISARTVIKGEISSENDIRVDGKVNGKIFSKGKIVVGPQAIIEGGLACTNVDFLGTMKGDIYVKDLLTVKSNATIEGNINVNKLQVEMGAQINGSCHMITSEEFEKQLSNYVTTVVPEKPSTSVPNKK
ncbi:MAG TPA: polymer-forming cytoskeletal protein [Rikenellaceae bacterium]|nr:polymer-forming cytoskeletal protein [Rikenellaceae bacterium]